MTRSLALVLVSLLAILTGCSARHVDWDNTGAPNGTGFKTRALVVDGTNRSYTVFVPHNYDPKRSYPVIMFLHGVLEGGNDGRKCVTVGLGPEVSKREATFQFFAVFPHSTSDWQGDDKARIAIAVLDQILKDFPGADPNRVVLTGLSNGGDGTWSIAARYPNRFAAIVPMCGKADYDDAPKLKNIPIRCYHNAVDPFRNSGNAREMCDRINKLGGHAQYIQPGGFGHDVWTAAYEGDDLFSWMASQRRH